MKKKQSILFVILLLLATIGYSQNTEQKNQLELSIGGNFGALKNLEFAPVSQFKYNGLAYALNYQRTNRNDNLFTVEFSYLNSQLKTDIIPIFNAGYSKTSFSFSYLKQMNTKKGFSIHLGLQSQSSFSSYDISNSNYQYFVFDQKIGIASQFRYPLDKKHYLSSKITIPFFLFRVTDADAYLKSFGNYQSISWNIKYGYHLTKHLEAKASYNFNYDRLQVPGAYRELQHQINLGINYKF